MNIDILFSKFNLHNAVSPTTLNLEMNMEKGPENDHVVACIPFRILWDRTSRKLLALGVESRGKCSSYLVALAKITFFYRHFTRSFR